MTAGASNRALLLNVSTGYQFTPDEDVTVAVETSSINGRIDAMNHLKIKPHSSCMSTLSIRFRAQSHSDTQLPTNVM